MNMLYLLPHYMTPSFGEAKCGYEVIVVMTCSWENEMGSLLAELIHTTHSTHCWAHKPHMTPLTVVKKTLLCQGS